MKNRPLNEMGRAELKQLIYDKIKTGLAPASVCRIKALVSVVLSHALEDGLIPAKPAAGLG